METQMKHSMSRTVLFITIISSLVIVLSGSGQIFEKPYELKGFFPKNIDLNDDKYILYYPNALATDSNGNVYVVDCGNNRVVKYSPEGKYLLQWGRQGAGPGE
ncbi:MAG: SBBP repeat-containing protein, partial [Acidobacteria bacterium]|nr:SBBP repeat-containing protein [Acidobacteriota bacterium]